MMAGMEECYYDPSIVESEFNAPQASADYDHDYSVTIGNTTWGFVDWYSGDRCVSWICAGPFGPHHVPFTATQGLVGFGAIVVGLVALVAVLSVRWKRKRAA